MNAFLLILLTIASAVLVARFAPQALRGPLLNALKVAFTVLVFWVLLSHRVTLEDGSREVAWRLVLETLRGIDARTFWAFVALAAGIKFVGILASMYRWTILLRGQAIDLPFRHIFGSFLIGRFIGTFLPSTAGLDGYKLYDAARFSGKTVEVTATTALEKVIGFSGIFVSFLVALPFGIQIFGEQAGLVAALTVPICVGIITALLLVLWYPGIVQWLLGALPIPGKSRLEGLILRIARAASAYRDKHGLVVSAFALSFIVHFSTAAMYYFTALAIGATQAEFWPVAFGSSIQILATVLSPFTIAGEGIREAAQYALLGHQIGAANAIISAALGFWAAEALTLLGGIFWMARTSAYRPNYCIVDGEQVDYAAASRAARRLIPENERAEASSTALPAGQRLLRSALAGLAAGLVGGALLGALEGAAVAGAGLGGDAQVLWYGPLAYALLLGGLGLGGGALLAVLPMDAAEIRGWTPSLVLLGGVLPLGLVIAIFRVRRDFYAEQMPPAPVLIGMLAAAGLLALLLFFLGPRVFRGGAGRIFRPMAALGAVALFALAGAAASRALLEPAPPPAPAAPLPAALAEQPNLILVMVDTLRADHLSCYGGSEVVTPNLCRLAEDGGSIFDGFSHASWTKPAAASLLSSQLPSSHGAISKPVALAEGIELVSEPLQRAGYLTGAVVSNINLAPSFGFDQGYDEYHYLAPDYLFGADESSSKLSLYRILRVVWFKLLPGLRVGDFYQPAEVVNRFAFDFLERNAEARFFLFLHYMDPHDPYFEHPWNGKGIARAKNQNPDPSQAPAMRELYRGEVAYLDRHFGELIERLEALGLYEDAVIALVADHGEEFADHGGFWHGLTLYEEQIRVPLLLKWARSARQVPPDARGPVRGLLDVAPTLLARAGVEAPTSMQGVDLAREVNALPESARRVLSEENHEGNVLHSLRTEEWKLIEANAGNPRGLPETELFRVHDDPRETRNRAGHDAARLAELRSHAAAQLALAVSRAGERTEAELDESELEALRALGYLEE